jgi:hypothetical protein
MATDPQPRKQPYPVNRNIAEGPLETHYPFCENRHPDWTDLDEDRLRRIQTPVFGKIIIWIDSLVL